MVLDFTKLVFSVVAMVTVLVGITFLTITLHFITYILELFLPESTVIVIVFSLAILLGIITIYKTI